MKNIKNRVSSINFLIVSALKGNEEFGYFVGIKFIFFGLHIIESCGSILFLKLTDIYSGEFKFLDFFLWEKLNI